MGWKIYDEAIEMVHRRFGYLPRAFCWRGRRYEVEAVERCWLSWGTILRRRPVRRFFRVRTGEGVFEIYRNLEAGTWHLRRARFSPAPRPSVGAAAPAWR
jgi:hypothetical protein